VSWKQCRAEPPHSLPFPDDTGTFYDSGFAPLYLLLGNLELGVKIAHSLKRKACFFCTFAARMRVAPILWLLHLRDFQEPKQHLPFCKRHVSGSVVDTHALRCRLVQLFSDVEVPILKLRCLPWDPESRSQIHLSSSRSLLLLSFLFFAELL
jgi:hypothetical protein